MFIAQNWKDYEVIDTSDKEKLERWGDYILVRPDPQVIWNTPKTNKGWKHMNAHYHRSAKGGGDWEFFDLPKQWQISYNSPSFDTPLIFNLKPFSFKHTAFSLNRLLTGTGLANLYQMQKLQTLKEQSRF